MKNRQSWLTWGIIIAIILGSGLLTIAWPAISGMFGGGGGEVRTPAENVTLALPIPVAGRSELSAPAWVWLGGLFFIIFGGLITTAIIIALVNWFLSRQVTKTVNDPGYQAEAAALQRKVDGRMKAKRAERPVHSIPDSVWGRFAKVTTTMVALMFAIFAIYLIIRTLFPMGFIIQPDQLVNITQIAVIATTIATIVIMALWLRGNRLSNISRTDNAALPWDFVIVTLTGLLVVGLGLGFVAYLNR